MSDAHFFDDREVQERFAELIRRDEIRCIELAHQRAVNQRLIAILSAIEMRCAPDDIVMGDKTMRFIPPDPVMYWRELSGKVRSIKAEMRAAFDEEDARYFTRPREN